MSGNNSYPVIMQAVVLETHGGPLQVKEVDIPGPGPDEVLIIIAAANFIRLLKHCLLAAL